MTQNSIALFIWHFLKTGRDHTKNSASHAQEYLARLCKIQDLHNFLCYGTVDKPACPGPARPGPIKRA